MEFGLYDELENALLSLSENNSYAAFVALARAHNFRAKVRTEKH